jgi:hypothetical protein
MRSGDRCECKECQGRLHVRNSEQHGDHQIQYLACAVCGHRPSDNKVVVPADNIRRRAIA